MFCCSSSFPKVTKELIEKTEVVRGIQSEYHYPASRGLPNQDDWSCVHLTLVTILGNPRRLPFKKFEFLCNQFDANHHMPRSKNNVDNYKHDGGRQSDSSTNEPDRIFPTVTPTEILTEPDQAIPKPVERTVTSPALSSLVRHVISGSGMTLFSYILKRTVDWESVFIAPGKMSGTVFSRVALEKNSSVIKAIVFSNNHAWALVRVRDTWYIVDSRDSGPPHPISSFDEHLGYIYVKPTPTKYK